MTIPHESVAVLSRALDQAGDVLTAVKRDQFPQPTPCVDWTVEQLVAHLIQDTHNFVTMMTGGEPDWSAEPTVPEDWVAAFRSGADDLIHLWHQREDVDGAGPSADMQTAEFAVHTWDLARATGHSGELDPEIAERGLSYLTAHLKPEYRGNAFGAEVEVAADASAYDRLVAFTGRDPARNLA